MESLNPLKRILIVGGGGYLGGRIASHLSLHGHKVTIATQQKSIYRSKYLHNVEVKNINWDGYETLVDACENIDILINAAGTNSQDSKMNPPKALHINGFGTANLIKACLEKCVRKFIYLSTVHVYSSPLVGTFREDSCPKNLHPYATSHLAGENAVLYQLLETKKISGAVLRISNAVGSPLDQYKNCWSLLVNDLCRQAAVSGEILIKSDPHIQRNFIPITNICSVIDIIVNSNLTYGILNVCSNKSNTLEEVSNLIVERAKHILQKDITINKSVVRSPRKRDLNIGSFSSVINQLNTTDNLKMEIDNLLINCREWFG